MRGLGDLSITIPGKRKLVKAPQALDLPRLKSTKVELASSVTVDVGEIAGDALERADRYLRARDAWIESVPGTKGGLSRRQGHASDRACDRRVPVISLERGAIALAGQRLLIMCMSSMPCKVVRAERKELKPSIGLTTRLLTGR